MASPPETPHDRDPEDEADFRFELHGTPCEWGESYRPGGYHPVILGDVIRDRYRIIRKLGYGSFSTVWLAVDLSLNCFAALKVAVASSGKEETVDRSLALYKSLPQAASRHIVSFRDSFEVLGPNGRHTCLVMDPMGPHIRFLMIRRPEFEDRTLEPWDRRPRFPKPLARQVLRDALLGLRVLHQYGIVHGDLHPGNILATIPPLGEPASVEQKLRQLPSEGKPLIRHDGKVDPWAPPYLLEPAPLQDLVSFELDPVVKLADLGAAFLEPYSPAKLVTPVALRAPEAILRDAQVPVGKGIDVWAFGCLVFELLTGSTLFVGLEGLDGDEMADEMTNDEHLIQFSEILGPLPGGFAARWRRRDRYYDEDGKRLYVISNRRGRGDAGSGTDDDGGDGGDVGDDGVHDADDDYGKARDEASPDSPTSETTLSESSSFWLADPGEIASLENQLRDLKPDDMDEDEVNEVSRLLRWILEYDASQRPSVEAILAHPWFSS